MPDGVEPRNPPVAGVAVDVVTGCLGALEDVVILLNPAAFGGRDYAATRGRALWLAGGFRILGRGASELGRVPGVPQSVSGVAKALDLSADDATAIAYSVHREEAEKALRRLNRRIVRVSEHLDERAATDTVTETNPPGVATVIGGCVDELAQFATEFTATGLVHPSQQYPMDPWAIRDAGAWISGGANTLRLLVDQVEGTSEIPEAMPRIISAVASLLRRAVVLGKSHPSDLSVTASATAFDELSARIGGVFAALGARKVTFLSDFSSRSPGAPYDQRRRGRRIRRSPPTMGPGPMGA